MNGKQKQFSSSESPLVDLAVEAICAEPIPDGPPQHAFDAICDMRLRHQRRKSQLLGRAAPALAASLLLAVFGTFLWPVFNGGDNVVFAKVLKEVEKVKSIRWTIEHYSHARNAGGTYKWRLESEARGFYKSPGLERIESYDEEGKLWHIKTTDKWRGIRLSLKPKLKEAVLEEYGPYPMPEKPPTRPRTFLSILENWISEDSEKVDLGKRVIDGKRVVGFRVKGGGERDADLWVDPKTHRIVRFYEPSVDIYDPENDPVARNKSGKQAGQEIKGWMWKNIEYDTPVENVSFSVTPPAEYSVTRIARREPTEKDFLEWLRTVAEFNESVFPERPELPIDAYRVPEEERSQAAKRIVQRLGGKDKDEYIYPLTRFIFFTAGDSWRYRGEGIELGDAEKEIARYQPKGSPNYRVIYGDLRVREVPPNELPTNDPQ